MVHMYHSFLIHSSADGYLGCFHVLAIINSALMNTGVHMSLSDLVSSVCVCPEVGLLGQLVQPLWGTVWRFLEKLEIELPCLLLSNFIKLNSCWTSLVVQWLRICLPLQKAQIPSLVGN